MQVPPNPAPNITSPTLPLPNELIGLCASYLLPQNQLYLAEFNEGEFRPVIEQTRYEHLRIEVQDSIDWIIQSKNLFQPAQTPVQQQAATQLDQLIGELTAEKERNALVVVNPAQPPRIDYPAQTELLQQRMRQLIERMLNVGQTLPFICGQRPQDMMMRDEQDANVKCKVEWFLKKQLFQTIFQPTEMKNFIESMNRWQPVEGGDAPLYFCTTDKTLNAFIESLENDFRTLKKKKPTAQNNQEIDSEDLLRYKCKKRILYYKHMPLLARATERAQTLNYELERKNSLGSIATLYAQHGEFLTAINLIKPRIQLQENPFNFYLNFHEIPSLVIEQNAVQQILNRPHDNIQDRLLFTFALYLNEKNRIEEAELLVGDILDENIKNLCLDWIFDAWVIRHRRDKAQQVLERMGTQEAKNNARNKTIDKARRNIGSYGSQNVDDARKNLIEILVTLDRSEEAQKELSAIEDPQTKYETIIASINIFSAANDPIKAEQWFNFLSQPDSSSKVRGAILNIFKAYVNIKDFTQAKTLFNLMTFEDIKKQAYHYIIKGYLTDGHIEEAKKLVLELPEDPPSPDCEYCEYTKSEAMVFLIEAMISHRQLEGAVALAKSISIPRYRFKVLEKLIDFYIQEGNLSLANELAMLSDCHHHYCPTTFQKLAEAYLAINNFEMAEANALKFSFHANFGELIRKIIVKAAEERSRIDLALRLADHFMNDRDSGKWIVFESLLNRHHDLAAAQQVSSQLGGEYATRAQAKIAEALDKPNKPQKIENPPIVIVEKKSTLIKKFAISIMHYVKALFEAFKVFIQRIATLPRRIHWRKT